MRGVCRTILLLALCSISGCQAARKTGKVATGAAAWLVTGIVDATLDGISDDDETLIEQHHRERHERKWKQFWRENPDVNPAMTAAFKDDYE